MIVPATGDSAVFGIVCGPTVTEPEAVNVPGYGPTATPLVVKPIVVLAPGLHAPDAWMHWPLPQYGPTRFDVLAVSVSPMIVPGVTAAADSAPPASAIAPTAETTAIAHLNRIAASPCSAGRAAYSRAAERAQEPARSASTPGDAGRP